MLSPEEELLATQASLREALEELTRVRDELKWKTAFMEAQANSSPDGIIVVNPEGKKILQNQRIADLFKIPPEIAKNQDDASQVRWVMSRAMHPEKFEERVAHLYSHPNEVSHDEVELKDGTILDRYSSPVMGEEGTRYGRVWTFRNITGRKQDQEALRENEERFTGAFDHAPIGIALLSPEGYWLRVNHALSEMLGYSEAELLSRSFQEVTHPDDLKDCLGSVSQMIGGEIKTCQSEKRYVHKDGHFVPVSFNLSLVRNEEGKPRYLIAQIQDITERRLAGEKLAANEVLLRQFVQYTPAAIAMLDIQMRYMQVSDRWIKDYHLVGRDIIGKSHYELFPDVPQRWRDIHQRVLSGAVESCAEDPFPRQDGSVDWLQWEARPWRKAGGEIGGLIFFTQVITERKHEEEQIRFNEQRFRSLVEATTAIVWDTPASGEFEVEQAAWSAFTGQSFEELKGWGWLDSIHPDDRSETARIWASAVGNRSTYEVEHRLWSVDGSYHGMMARAVPILGTGGEIRQWIGVHIDISERKRAEVAMRERAQLAELAAEARLAWTRSESLSKTLQVCCEAIVRHLDGAFARVWTLNEKEQMLELQASAGMYTHLDGLHGRVRVGQFKIGLIALDRKPHLTNQVVGDPHVSDQEWAEHEGMVGFAGYPLIVAGRLVGVVAMFARHALSDSILAGLASVADNIALSIERKQGEEWLRLLSSAVEQANESIVITDAQLEGPGPRIIFVNPAYTLMTGYTAAETIGKTPRHLQGPKTDRAVLDRLRGNLERGEVFKGQAVNYRKNGTEFTLEWQVTPLRNDEGGITHFLAIQRDITERMQKEEHLRLLGSAMKQSKESIVITDAELDAPGPRIVFVNPAFTEMTGYAIEDAIGRTPRILQGPKTDRSVLDRLRHCLEQGEAFEGRAVNYRKDGREFDLEWQITPIRDLSGKIINFVALQRDITARKLAEEELSQSSERLRGILDHIPQRVFWKDINSVYLGCNQALATDLGFSHPDEVIGKTDFETNSKTLAELYRASDQGIIHSNLAALNVEEPGRAADGSPLWLRTSKVPLHDQEGRVTGILGTYEDVTEAKRVKLEIQKLEAHLVQSQKLETVGKLAGGIAHEFNSILTAIIGQSELLLTDLPSSSPLVKSASEIGKAAGRAAILTRQLLAYGRRQLLQTEILDLNRVLGGMKDMLLHLMGGEVEILIHPSGVRAIKADAGQIEQVVLNMAMNARDAMPNGGKLTLETDSISVADDMVGYPELNPGEYVTLTITDTGMGMSAEVKARVFEPFFSTKAAGEGTGLGLSTCYGIIKQSGGHVGVYSEPGRGSSFKIYLPQIKQEPGFQVSQPAVLNLPGGTETILLVEDDPALREMAGVLLRRLGYKVLEAAHGIEALAMKQRPGIGHIDLLFTDVVMPHMSGKELGERVRALFPETRILFTSAYTGNAMAHQGMLDQGVALLQKPFTPSALAAKVREVLDS